MYSIQRCLSITVVLCLLAACAPASNNSNSVSINNPTPSPSAAVSPSPAKSETASVQITLPLLDALLTDEKFVGQLKSNLKLTDDQVAQLKRVSSAAIDHLRETNAEDVDGVSSTDARNHASEQLRTILGDEKSKQLASLVNDYWSKGDVTAGSENPNQPQMSATPNAVPTDTRVVVNIPAFRMDLFQDGKLVKSYKVGIGYPEFPLPIGLRKANQVIFNPTWTPPDSPWVAKMKNVTAGETIKPGDKDNPLGPIKIPIGLPSLIHGGKSPAKIGKFASHGCVGLTTPQMKDFAVLLGKAADTPDVATKMDTYLADKDKTETVKLSQTVPVELRYETIVLEDGKLHIYKDVYAQHTNTEENLRKVLSANCVKFQDLSEEQRQKALDALNSKSNKEVVIDLGGIAQKGYPAPVNLDTGAGKATRTKK